jgi:hypothetical protein
MATGNWLEGSQRQPVVFAVGLVSVASSFFPGHLSALMHEKFAVCLLILEAPVLVSYSLATVDSSSFQVPVFEY